MKRKGTLIITFVLTLVTMLMSTTVYGADVSGTTHIVPILANSTNTVLVTKVVESSEVSSAALFDQGKINSTGLNMALQVSGLDVPMMPGSLDLDIKYAFNNAAVEETTEATDSTINDITLPALNAEVYEFSLDHASKFLKMLINTSAVASSYVVTWEYYNGATWAALPSVVDGTSNFTITGLNTISWDIPSDWTKQTLHTSKSGFWVRANVAASGITTAPLATRVWYETGNLFYYIPSIDTFEIINQDLFVGGTDFQTSYFYFPGFEGLVTLDDSDIEFGNNWGFITRSGLRFDTNETGNIFNKTGTATLSYSSATSNNVLTLSAPSSILYGEWTHNEEDGLSYYSGTSEESYSKTFYNASSNYITSRQEDSSDSISNISSEVTNHKIGQAYDKVIDTTPAIGAKINDPS